MKKKPFIIIISGGLGALFSIFFFGYDLSALQSLGATGTCMLIAIALGFVL